MAQVVKESAFSRGDLGSIPGLEDPLEKGIATHASILAWRIPWREWATLHGVTESWNQMSDLARMHAQRVTGTNCTHIHTKQHNNSI